MWNPEDHISKVERKLVDNYCPTRCPWFVKFIKVEKTRMGIIRMKDSGILVFTMSKLQRTWDLEW